MRADLLECLMDEADMLRAEGLDDLAVLLEEAVVEIMYKDARANIQAPVYIDITKGWP